MFCSFSAVSGVVKWPYMQFSMLFHTVSLGWLGCNILISWGHGRVITFPVFLVCLQVDWTGNCLFSAVRKSLLVHTTTAQEATCFPNWYFRRMVINYMVNHHQLVYNKFLAMMSLYDVEKRVDPDRGWNPPLSFNQYLRLLLRWDFWGDKVVLYATSCMWPMKITVLNTETLQEYNICHDRFLDDVNVIITFNVVNHFNTMGE